MKFFKLNYLLTAAIFTILLSSSKIYAHCDGVDGPVVKSAKKALETGNVNLVLIWVGKNDENTIKDSFSKTMKVRKLNDEARELADSYFFETLVRIHRAGEGEPYTGLKPSGRDLGPVIPAADRSIEEGSIKPLKDVFAAKNLNTSKVESLFNAVMKNRSYETNDIQAGRKYVHSYVEFLHTAEHLYESGRAGDQKKDNHHKLESAETPAHSH